MLKAPIAPVISPHVLLHPRALPAYSKFGASDWQLPGLGEGQGLLHADAALQAFSFLEMPAALAAGHISAVAASCLLPAAALDQAQSAAQATIQDAAGRLQAIYGSSLDLTHSDAMSTLLGKLC